MNKYEEIYLAARQNQGFVSWIDVAVPALAFDIEKATGKPVRISGPCGIRAEVYVDVGDKYICLTPEFCGEKLILYFDTGEITDTYAPDTLGAINGMNNVRARLPGTLDEIIKVLRPSR